MATANIQLTIDSGQYIGELARLGIALWKLQFASYRRAGYPLGKSLRGFKKWKKST